MLSEIGSNFWIKPEELELNNNLGSPCDFGFDGSDYVWMSTGRSATMLVLKTIEEKNPLINKVAVLPPFTCHTVVEPFLERGYTIFTYKVDKNLQANVNDIQNCVEQSGAKLLLFHRLFGIDTTKGIDNIVERMQKLGVVIIEDCTQCVYSTFKKSSADFHVCSIRKWCGVPDGGFAVCKDGVFNNKPTTFDISLQDSKKDASIMKYEYLFNGTGNKKLFLSKYREAEDILDEQKEFFAISELSACIQSHLDVELLKNKRRENFKIVAGGLKDIKGIQVIFPTLEDDETPLYCPILCDNRPEVQNLLVNNSIFAPIVWPKAECCPEVNDETDYVYDHILCIPIDQRYDRDDIERVVDVIKSLDI